MKKQPRPHFPIVGVGASAGGIAALESFFGGIPADPAFAIVVVTHLSPARESHLHEIVRRFTQMDVHIAEDDAEVARGAVYVLPADAVLGITDGRLRISRTESNTIARKPIDIFLGSLAKDVGEYSAAAILSGADGDGTLGVKAVKERGGLTLAQVADGDGPSYPDMPSSAIASGFVDLAIGAAAMGAEIAKFARTLTLLDGMASAHDDRDGQHSMDAARKSVCEILRHQVGHDFSGYKARTFMRRVHRRMQVLQLEDVGAYIERLRQDSREVNDLFRDLLINVTNFFRDKEAFEALANLVVPRLFENHGADNTVRVWVPGCATGEEVYSIAILLREHMDTLRAVPRVQIFATDIDEPALNVARTGRYPETLLESVSAERRRRFFVADAGSFVLSKEIRDLCIFSPHSVIRDPPFSRIDLVSCRNLLIYFGPDIQGQVIPTFHYSLRDGGYLFLGTSENVTQYSDLFTPLDTKQRLFRARKDRLGIARLPPQLTGLHALTAGSQPRPPVLRGLAFRHVLESRVLERHAPAHVVADREGEVVFYSSRTGKYLEPAAGAPTRQLFTLARRGLRMELRAVFRQAVETGHPATRDDIELESDEGHIQLVAVTVEPLPDANAAEPLFVVLFVDQGPPLSREAATARGKGGPDSSAIQLDADLRETRERLQSVVEEYETALEELKSSNEELVSVNEESQSTNEELEASKEELQSLNEELHTVNAELHGKVEALDSANADLQNLFDNSQVAMVFLDRDLSIRTFTPAMGRIFNVRSSDRGRPLTDLSSRIPLPSLLDDVSTAIERGKTTERRISHDLSAAHFLARVAPYRDSDQRIRGAVVTLIDVTSLTEAETHQRTLVAELNHRVRNMLAVVIGLVEQNTKKNSTIDEFKDDFIPRLHAMSRTYDLVSRENWTYASLDEQVRLELAPFSSDNISIEGPSMRLKPKQALAFGMTLHELATNSVKYGALSAPDGRVEVSWTRSQDPQATLRLHWRERGGPTVNGPVERGFGLRLIEGQVTHTLHGTMSIDFAPEGLGFVFEVPIDNAGSP